MSGTHQYIWSLILLVVIFCLFENPYRAFFAELLDWAAYFVWLDENKIKIK